MCFLCLDFLRRARVHSLELKENFEEKDEYSKSPVKRVFHVSPVAKKCSTTDY